MFLRSFCATKFWTFLLSGTFAALAGFASRFTDAIVVGHVIGEDALAGLNMATPILSGVAFVALLIAMGTATSYSICMGRLERERACGFFSQGLMLALLVGVMLSLLMCFGEDWYLSCLNGSEYVEMYARQYLDWAWPLGLLECALTVLLMLCCVDGDIGLAAIACGIEFAVNAGCAYVAVAEGMGASGCALADLVSVAVGLLVLSAHFFRKVNTCRLVARFSFADVRTILRSSFGSAAVFLCDAVLFFVLNKIVIGRFGSDFLPVAGLAIVVWLFLRVFGGVSLAAQPFVTVYWGEGNVVGIRRVMAAAMVASLVSGVGVLTLLAVFPNLAVGLLGVEYPELVVSSRQCVLLMCVGFLPMAFTHLFNGYFLFIERPALSLSLTVLVHLLLPVCCLLVGSSFGLNGVWLGLGVGPWMGVCLLALVLLAKGGAEAFPLQLSSARAGKIRMFDLVLTEEAIVRTSREVADALPPEVASRAALMVEEVFMIVRERNLGRRTICGEVTLDFNDGIVMTLRDDGVLFDITDADARISSLRAYLVASVMERQRERLNLITTGFNRNVFRFA